MGCGGGSKQEPPQEPTAGITVTPSTATIHYLEGIDLHASGSSLVPGATVDWTVEQDPSCTWESSPSGPQQEPAGPCNSGTIWVQTPTGNLPATYAIYYAPSSNFTPGTYHVFAKEQLPTGETAQAKVTIKVIPHTVDIAITPSGATIPVNSSVDLQATGSSVEKYTNIYWYVQEDRLACTTESVPPQPPSVPCPAGWMWEEMSVGEFPRVNSTYYSPGTPGTYHVVAHAELLTNETGEAVATITVTP